MVRVKRYNDLFGVDREYIPTVRVRVHDYPGESHYRQQAIKQLSGLEKRAVVIFIMRVGFHEGEIQYTQENAEYFSQVFVEELGNSLVSINKAVAKAIVVFNKTDLLPEEWPQPVAFENLKQANKDALYNIRRTFNPNIEYCMTSAFTNKGIIRLLGLVGRAGMEDSPAEVQRFIDNLRIAEDEFEKKVFEVNQP